MSRFAGRAICVLAACGTLVCGMTTSTASAGGAQPTVTIVSLGGQVLNHVSCEGDERLSAGQGIFDVSRDVAEPSPLSVTLTYGGTLEPGVDYDALPATVTIPSNETNVAIFFRATVTGSVTATIDADTAYIVGSPDSAVASLTGPVDQHECGTAAPQTIALGDTPAAIDVYDTFGDFIQIGGLEIEGTVPPGLTFNPEGTWEGTPQKAGSHEFVARYCIRGARCIFNLTVAITVATADSAPARPVVASPAFTG